MVKNNYTKFVSLLGVSIFSVTHKSCTFYAIWEPSTISLIFELVEGGGYSTQLRVLNFRLSEGANFSIYWKVGEIRLNEGEEFSTQVRRLIPFTSTIMEFTEYATKEIGNLFNPSFIE